jgi:hypothetical protein
MRISIGTGAAVDATDTICLDNVKVTHIGLGYDGNLASVLADSSKSLTEFDRTSFGDGYAFSKTAAIANIGDIGYSTVSDIENALCEGDELVLLGDVLATLNVPCGFSVYNPDGYKFNYDKGSYDASKGVFVPKDGVEVDDAYIKRIKSIVGNKINYSKSAISLDYFNVVFGDK